MLAVIVCSLFNLVVLAGLLAGIVVGVVRARGAIATALAFEPFAPISPLGSATVATPWLPA